MPLSNADRVWNRAAIAWNPVDRAGGAGDIALAALLAAHSMVMNGGVAHCHEVLDHQEVADACAGFRYFGMAEVADFLASTEAKSRMDKSTERDELDWDAEYWRLVPTSQAIVKSFEAQLAAAPQDFWPIGDE